MSTRSIVLEIIDLHARGKSTRQKTRELARLEAEEALSQKLAADKQAAIDESNRKKTVAHNATTIKEFVTNYKVKLDNTNWPGNEKIPKTWFRSIPGVSIDLEDFPEETWIYLAVDGNLYFRDDIDLCYAELDLYGISTELSYELLWALKALAQ